ncbi:glycosyltransferase family 2 protein [Marivirga sp. S37H4]|uniref:Glycosyltransferase family 2 protein n=1 Tax=Marivirga aurantiaca TaxID=2802615 RepID=A0A935C9G7_9BACT|nr:glycosyltransferase family 2 protein [Marivirga aurantiaca]MBK6266035.1 glycosyltransferase family 2 protein [Marivirga aurantiaca]
MSYSISVVIPVFNEDESLRELHDWIQRVMKEHPSLTYEVIMIDDGSTDESWEVISELASQHRAVKGIKFSRNYGKSAALHTGFNVAQGDVVITMDADMQDSPDEIPALYDKVINENYDIVSGWKKKRHDPVSKTIPSKFFNLVTRKISGIKLHDFNCGLKAYRKKVVKNIEVYGEMHRYIPVIAKWSGFRKIGEKEVVHRARKYGETKYGLERFLYGFLDLLSITFVSKFKKSPMHFFGTLGTLSFIFGFFVTIYIIGKKFYEISNNMIAREITDQPLFFLALVALIVGVQLFLAGFIGEMITMNSPRKTEYIIEEEKGF